MKLKHIIPYSSRLTFFLLFILSISCAQTKSDHNSNAVDDHKIGNLATDTTTVTASCFYCVEEQITIVKSITAVVFSYSGGHVRIPTFPDVTTGRTGNAENYNIIYNPDEISYDELPDAYFVAHDPT